MKRSEFIRRTSVMACSACAGALLGTNVTANAAEDSPNILKPEASEDVKRIMADNEFINRWLTDLFDVMETDLNEATMLRLMQGCGRRCFERHQFKQDIAEAGKGSIENLVKAYRKNFGARLEGDVMHILYGKKGKCFCPAAKDRPSRPNDLHCECTRSTHQLICEKALGRPVRVEILESVRRGGKTCHLIAHVGD